MVGILLISHGEMCNGMKNSLEMFFGKDIRQFDTLSLLSDMGAQEYGLMLKDKIEMLDSGDGVVIFADMLGGTPCNQALQLLSDSVELIVGMNLPAVMELLGQRESMDVDISQLVDNAKATIIDAKAMFNSSTTYDEEDD